MTSREIPLSGTSKQPQSGRLTAKPAGAVRPPPLPTVLPYPPFSPFASASPHLKDRLCYVIRHFGRVGLSVLIARQPKLDKIAVLCGDWAGNNIDLAADSTNKIVQAALVFVQEDLKLFLHLMHTIKLMQAQFFLAVDDALTLVDIQTAANKLVGPGMIRDLFGKVYKTQEILKVEVMDDRALEYLDRGTGSYEGDLILKPSRFATFSPQAATQIIPLYAELKRT